MGATCLSRFLRLLFTYKYAPGLSSRVHDPDHHFNHVRYWHASRRNPPENFPKATKLLLAGEVFVISAISISKTSFAVTLLRLTTQDWQRYLLWYIIISLNTIMGLCCIFQYIQCTPVQQLWDASVGGTCWDPYVQIHYSIFAGCQYLSLTRPTRLPFSHVFETKIIP